MCEIWMHTVYCLTFFSCCKYPSMAVGTSNVKQLCCNYPLGMWLLVVRSTTEPISLSNHVGVSLPWFGSEECHVQIIAHMQCSTLRCTTCSKTPHPQPPTLQTLTHTPVSAQGRGRRIKYIRHNLTRRWVAHNKALRRVLTAHHDRHTSTRWQQPTHRYHHWVHLAQQEMMCVYLSVMKTNN